MPGQLCLSWINTYQSSKSIFELFQKNLQFIKAFKCISAFFRGICTPPLNHNVKPSLHIFLTHRRHFNEAAILVIPDERNWEQIVSTVFLVSS